MGSVRYLSSGKTVQTEAPPCFREKMTPVVFSFEAAVSERNISKFHRLELTTISTHLFQL